MRVQPTAESSAAPLDPAEAARALDAAADREQIFSVLLRAARSRVPFAALLSVHRDGFRGRRAVAGDRFDGSTVKELRIPREAVPSFELAASTRSPYLGPIAAGEPAVAAELTRLGGVTPTVGLVLPIVLAERAVALLVGHRGGEPLTLDEVSDLMPLVTETGRALQRILARRAEAAAERPAPTPTPAPAATGSSGIIRAVTERIDEIEAQRRVIAVCREYESWAELAEALRALLRTALERGEPDEEEQLELLYELGRVEAERLGRPALAIEAWRSAQTIDAADPRIAAALEQLLVKEARWEELADLLERRAALAEDAEARVATLLELAQLARDRLLDDARAIETYERVRSWAPADERAAEALEALYRAHGRWEPLVALLLDVASRSEDPDGRVAALEAAAQLYEEQLGNPRAAFLVWLTVLRREPQRRGGLEALEHLGAVAGAWDELEPECAALAAELEAVDAEAAARLWRQVGRWRRDYLGQTAEAADALDRARRRAPDDVELLEELLPLRRAAGPWPALAALLGQRAEGELDPARRAELLVELGALYEARLSQPAEAQRAWEEAAAADPPCAPALRGLQRLHRGREAWPELAAALQRLADALGDGAPRDEALAIHLELGEVLAERLGRPEEAIRPLQAALALDPANARVLSLLAGAYEATGQAEAWLATVEAELDTGASPPDARRYTRLATGWEELGQLDRAAACWQKALAVEDHEAAHEGLVRTLRRAGRWTELARAHRAHLQAAFGVAKRVGILLALAADLERGAGDLDGAIAACREALALEPDDPAALDLLARCQAAKGRPQEALETLERLYERVAEARAKADVRQRVARVHAGVGDQARALVAFELALGLDPTSAQAHEGIARLYLAREDWPRAADHLRRAGLAGDDRFEAIAWLTEAAALYRERLNDLDKAGECLQKVVELDPDHADARDGLAETLARSGNWAALWPHLARQAEAVRQDPQATPDEKRRIWLEAARCALELGKAAEAIELLDRTVALDPTYLPVLLERVAALGRAEQWEAVIKACQAVLVQRADALDAATRADVFCRVAQAHRQLGRPPQAIAYYRKVLEVEPRHPQALQALADLHVERRQFDEAMGSLRALAEVVAPPARPQVLERIGDLARDGLKNPGRAASAWLDALAVDPTNRRLLQKLLDLQSETGQWKAALDTISRFLDLETDPRRRGKYFLARAAIRRFEVKEEAAAAEDYQRALDGFLDGSEPLDEATRASAFQAFEGLDELLAAQKDWTGRDRAHRRLIKRLPPGDPKLVGLWHALGEIHRTGLGQPESAILAFETAHSLDPQKSPERVRILAELAALVGKQAPAKATDHAARLVDAEPDNPEAYRAMGKACLEAGRIDEAWCVSRALVHRGQATREEEAFYRQHQALERRKAKGILDDDAWALLRDAGEDPVVSAIFALTWEAAVAPRAGPPKSFGLKPKERLKVEDPSRPLGKIFQNAARVLNAPLPHVYVQPERPGRLLLASCVEDGRLVPTVIVARDLMAGYRDTEVVFCVASTLALLRPAWYLRLALPTVAELEAALAAAVGLARPGVAVRPELAALHEAFSVEMRRRLTPQAAELLPGLVARLGERPDLARWRDGVDAAARRAALLVCGELDAAARMVSTEPALPDGPRPGDKVRDLVVFSVSPGYFAARRRLGVTVA